MVGKSHSRIPSAFVVGCLLTAAISAPGATYAGDYLDAGTAAGVGLASVSLWGVGQIAQPYDSSRGPLWTDPLPGESRLQRMLGGELTVGKTNFLDGKTGSAITPVACALILTAADLGYPQGTAGKDAGQDLFLYTSGLMANKGLTDFVKGLVSRPRPFVRLAPDYEQARYRGNADFNHHSFISGHASSAFFSVTFLNKRMRSIMRREMSGDEYRNWRWAPPAVLYGWGAFVC